MNKYERTRYTTVHDRFIVGDDICGMVCSEQTKSEAFISAKHHTKTGPCSGVTVYDLMAHRGKPQEWDIDGSVISKRSVE